MLKNITDLIDQLIRSSESLNAFDHIRKLTIMNPFKRDGGIMNCYENDEERIIVGNR